MLFPFAGITPFGRDLILPLLHSFHPACILMLCLAFNLSACSDIIVSVLIYFPFTSFVFVQIFMIISEPKALVS
jgi:hypothetical protein